MGRFPHLRLALVDIGATEPDEPTTAIELRNLGNAPAVQCASAWAAAWRAASPTSCLAPCRLAQRLC
jgi:hypothetical protein